MAVTTAVAQPSAEDKLPRSGSLSRSISGVYDSRAVPEPWGGVDAQGQVASPISGSVSKIAGSEWVMKVFNNSEDVYNVDVAVTQYEKSGRKVKTDSFSYTLRSKQSAERKIIAVYNTEQCALDLVRWRKVEHRKPGQAINNPPVQ